MIFDTLRLFRDIAQTRSFSEGARLNDIGQSSASQQIQELERNLSVTLIDRSTRPLVLTGAGKLYLDLCRDVLRRDQEFHAALDQLKTMWTARCGWRPSTPWDCRKCPSWNRSSRGAIRVLVWK